MNSAGDTGAAECDYGTNLAVYGYAVSYPASSQYVTGVGGTSIPYHESDEYSSTFGYSTNQYAGQSAKGYTPEQPWNDSQEFGYLCTVADESNLRRFGIHFMGDHAKPAYRHRRGRRRHQQLRLSLTTMTSATVAFRNPHGSPASA